jgi:hypothetical protein
VCARANTRANTRANALAELKIKGDTTRWGRVSGDDAVVDISLGNVLRHFQDEDFVKTELCKFALVGFNRYNLKYGPDTIKLPYKRTHVYSAVILNVKMLLENQPKLEFDKAIHLWEDLDFNERVNAAGLLICKCQRFCQKKDPKMPQGGANYMIASAPSAVASAAVQATPASTELRKRRRPSPSGTSPTQLSKTPKVVAGAAQAPKPLSGVAHRPAQEAEPELALEPAPALDAAPEPDDVAAFFRGISKICQEDADAYALKCAAQEVGIDELKTICEDPFADARKTLVDLLGPPDLKIGRLSLLWKAVRAQ